MTPEEIGKVLAEARAAWSLDVDTLASRACLDKAVVQAAELGKAAASELAAIAGALGGTLDDVLARRRFWEAPAVAFKNRPSDDDVTLIREALFRVGAAARDRDLLVDILNVPPPEFSGGVNLAPVQLLDDVVTQAEELAATVRRALGNELEPIASVRDVLRRVGVPAFLTDVGTQKVDGFMWRDENASAYAAANIRARGGKSTAIRMTLAHELCHALFDGTKLSPLGLIEHRSDHAEGLEQRANAFGVYFLAPRVAVGRFLKERGLRGPAKPTRQHVIALSEHFGLGVKAIGWHLMSCGYWNNIDVANNLVTPRWAHWPLDEADVTLDVPVERQGDVLDFATVALERGLISLARWRDFVGLSHFDPWEKVLQDRQVTRDVEHRVPPL
ncbi:MAG TPA: ImmA/IrrE family metallo-endopeptidase [Acidimicrobiales bacterium]|nr:ImmA/IrrE family metallo-endopeptidase [Acidimicrobiales bacterium]